VSEQTDKSSTLGRPAKEDLALKVWTGAGRHCKQVWTGARSLQAATLAAAISFRYVYSAV